MTLLTTLLARPDSLPTRTPCPDCSGVGRIAGDMCETCFGTGRLWVKLRSWQQMARRQWNNWVENRQSGDSRTFVAAVAGGAGKTHFGAAVAKACEADDIQRVVVICPSITIVQQWLNVLNEIDLRYPAMRWEGGLVSQQHIVTTYHMLFNNPDALRQIVTRKTLVIMDECHHLGGQQAWADSAKKAFANASYRLMLTGTPFREDDARIPFVTYNNGQLVTNYQFDYGEALDAGYVRPIYVQALDALSSWQHDNDYMEQGLLELGMSHFNTQQTLNTALNPQTDWFKHYIQDAQRQLHQYQVRGNPEAAGIIACVNQDHARQVQRVVQQITHTNPVLAISDDKDSDAKIEKFRESDTDWLIVVRKGSEGMDIPRLRVGVYATNITTELFFLQFALRLSRQQSPGESATLFIPAHPKLLEYARNMRQMRLHVLAPEVLTPLPVERRTTGQSTPITPLTAEAGATVQVEITPETSPLERLIQIRNMANAAINHLARDAYEQLDTKPAATGVNNVLGDIAALLQVEIPTSPKANGTAQTYEQQRQWRNFKALFESVQNMPAWCRDVLSLMWANVDNPLRGTAIFQAEPSAPKSYFTTDKSKNPLIKANLLTYRDGRYHTTIADHLADICPAYDADTLVGYLLSGQLPEKGI